MARARGSLEKRGEDTWRITIELEPDPETGERERKRETFHGDWKAADARKRRLLDDAEAGRLPKDDKLTVADFLERWLADIAPSLGPKTADRYRQIVENEIVPYIGKIKLGKLRPKDIQGLLTKLLKRPLRNGKEGTLSPQTVKHVLRVLHDALAAAVRWHDIGYNPAVGVKAPKVPRQEMQTYTAEEASRLLAAAGEEGTKWQALFTVLATTGLRPGEAVGLRWQDMDLDAGFIRVQQSAGPVKGKGIVVKPTKTSGSRRSVALSSGVVALLRRHKAEQNEVRLRAGPAWPDLDLVFPSALGLYLQASAIHHVFTRVCARAGVPRLRPYDLRHTAASLLLAEGVHPKVVAERLGHSTVNLTLNTYSHVLPGLQADAAGRLDKLVPKFVPMPVVVGSA